MDPLAIDRLLFLAQKHGCTTADIVRLNPHKAHVEVFGVGAVFTSLAPNEAVYVPQGLRPEVSFFPPPTQALAHHFAINGRNARYCWQCGEICSGVAGAKCTPVTCCINTLSYATYRLAARFGVRGTPTSVYPAEARRTTAPRSSHSKSSSPHAGDSWRRNEIAARGVVVRGGAVDRVGEHARHPDEDAVRQPEGPRERHAVRLSVRRARRGDDRDVHAGDARDALGHGRSLLHVPKHRTGNERVCELLSHTR